MHRLNEGMKRLSFFSFRKNHQPKPRSKKKFLHSKFLIFPSNIPLAPYRFVSSYDDKKHLKSCLKNQTPVIDSRIKTPIKSFLFFASTLPGLEWCLRHELTSLGVTIDIDQNKESSGGCHFRVSSLEHLMKCHLHLGTASHIYLRAGDPFRATRMEELVRKVAKMDFWKQYLCLLPTSIHRKPSAKSTLELPGFRIRVTSSKSRLYHTKGIAERVERGIIESLGTNGEFFQTKIGSCKENINKIPILVRIDRDQVQISVDTSATPLHKRGYRLEGGKAPLREDIAFALLYSLGWKAKNHDGLCDPMCGSGTILIEGAAMAVGLPPGRLRPAPMQNSQLYDEKKWRQLIDSACSSAQTKRDLLIIGSDRDVGSIKVAKKNIARAGVSSIVQVHNCSVSANPWFEDPSKFRVENMLIATNPPYGLRISKIREPGKRKNLLPLFQTLGKKFTEAGTDADFGIIANDIRMARQTGVRNLKALFTTRHGGLSVSALGTTRISD